MSEKMELKPCPFCGDKAALNILEDEPGEILTAWVSCMCGTSIGESLSEERATERWNTRASSPAQEPVTTEPVALDRATKRAMFVQEDDRALPTQGQIPWKQLGRDVRDVMFGTRSDYPFDETYYPGHQIIPSMNFNSLARIVDKYRWEGIAIPAPPQPGREVLRKLVDIVWNEATESKAVPSTKWADRLIDRALIGGSK